MNIATLKRGFEEQEFEGRMQKAQEMMSKKKLDAILLTTQANIFYFTGFLTQFWKSPTRPWFVVLPLQGKPIAVIPCIGKSGMAQTWVDDIHCWDSPNPKDDGVSILTKVLDDCCKKFNKIGVPLGIESKVHMPYDNFTTILKSLSRVELVDVALELHKIRAIKSSAEIEKISAACTITNQGFDALPSHARAGQSERQISKDMTINLLKHGADFVEYLICGSGPGGYDSIIMGPTGRIIEPGDIAIFDTGTTFDGYYSDFCRNFAFGTINDETKKANDVVHRSIDAAFDIAKPGTTTKDLFNAMWSVLEEGGALGNDVGRLGHGLGCELTEWPSNTPHNEVTLQAGMVITLEPGMYYAEGKSLVHEENIVITENGAQWLSRRADHEIPVIN
jgi:Xaa-Pro aminopeptidase